MNKSMQNNSKTKKITRILFHGYRRLFVLVFAIVLLGQAVSLLQDKLGEYHMALKKDFKMLLVVNTEADNEALTTMGESLSAKQDITSVKLFAPTDGLAALQARNPRLASALVTLGREPMPAYFEIKLADRVMNNITTVAQNLAAEYPQLSVKYAAQQAEMMFISAILLRAVNSMVVLALVLFVVFMFLVEAYPAREQMHAASSILSAVLAWGLSFVILVAVLYPAGILTTNLADFTSWTRQGGMLLFSGLLGWTLSKWQKF